MSTTGNQPGVKDRRNSGRTTSRTVQAAEREAQALALRRAGASYPAIAKELGINKGSAHRLVERGLERTVREPAEGLRALENERLDALQLAHWRDALGTPQRQTDADGTVRVVVPTLEQKQAATRVVLQVLERRAKLNGLDQPAELRLALAEGQVDFMEETIRGLLDGIAATLASAGLERQLAEVWPTILGEVVPGVINSVAAIGPAPGAAVTSGA